MAGDRNKFQFLCRAIPLALLLSVVVPRDSVSQTPFYQGKTITVIHNSSSGGSGDLRLRTVVAHLKKHIPGNPALTIEYMPGGGGRKTANFIFNSARPDGLTMGNMGSGLIPNAVLKETGVQYDLNRFIYLGSALSGTQYVFMTRREAGLNSLEKLRSTPGVRVGAHSIGHIVYAHGRIFSYMIGLKDPRFVTGYSDPELTIAMAQGEIDARAQIVNAIVLRNPEWVDKGLMDFHAVNRLAGHEIDARFARLPDLGSFAKSEKDRKVLALFVAFQETGTPLVLPPGVPKERSQIIQEAMRKTFKDPEFRRDFKKITGEDAAPIMPEELEKAIKQLPQEPEVIELYKKLAGGDPLPSR
jgi:tripartite-type tricarboxylate transporter receptor subunit TctC